MRRMKTAMLDAHNPLAKDAALARRLDKALDSRAAILEAAKAAQPSATPAAKPAAPLR
jgi:hypothetical protein